MAMVRGADGPDAERIAANVFVRREGKNGKLASHRLCHGQDFRTPARGNFSMKFCSQ